MKLWGNKKKDEPSEAELAKYKAAEKFAEAEQRQPQVEERASSLRELYHNNHFAQTLQRIYKEGA